ncbi:MAG: D-glycerate dehydrogenase [Betaproteobacteria bacterium]|nr:D-glycerate dehydrogenase [Betaproteobacteria bacterium]MCC7218859.1 D-glycerate dehydrogenase [Burkholderiales bacterium]
MTALARALVTLDLPAEALAVFAGAFAVDYAPEFDFRAPSAAARVAGCDVLVVSATKDRLDAAAIGALPPGVRAIATYSIGHEHVDLAAARARGIAVFATPEVLSDAVAEVGMLLLLGAARRVTESVDLIRSGRWTGWAPTQLNGTGLAGKVLGIVGMGRIGRAVARRARAFGMAIHYANRTRLDPAREAGASFHADPESLLRVAQFLLLACPATPETTGFLDARRIALLPRGAVVANVGRGAVVVDADLADALASGHVAAAGLDVFAGEPAVYPRYFALPNVFMLPHIGSSTLETRIAMAQVLVAGLAQFGRGEPAGNRLA